MANGKLLGGKPSGGVTTVTFQDGVSNTDLVLPESGTVASTDGATVDNTIPRYDGTSGKLQGSGVTVNDLGAVTFVNTGSAAWGFSSTSSGYTGSGTSKQIYMNYFNNSNSATTGIYISGTSTSGNDIQVVDKFLVQNDGKVLAISPTGGIGYGAGAGGTVTQLISKSNNVVLNKPCGTIIMNNGALAAGASVAFPLNNTLLAANDMLYVETDINSTAYQVKVYRTNAGIASIQVTNTSAGSLSDALVIKFAIIKGANS